MRARLFQIMSNIFDVPIDEINEDSSPDTIESWESLKHMNLIAAMEEEFDVKFTDEQIVNMLNVKLILYTLEELNID